MSTTIRRKPTTARKAAARDGAARKAAQARANRRSLLDRAMGWLPFSEAQWRRLFLALMLAVAAALAVAVALAVHAPQLAAGRFADLTARAGFAVRRVDVRGVRNMNEIRVYQQVLGQRQRSMAEVDLGAVRAGLLDLAWVKDARVSRQLPDTLVVDIVERTPHAVLRKPGGRLMLIDDTGRELEPVAADRVGRRLIVSGPGAGQNTVALDRLLDGAPALRPQIREADWVGNRRWNLIFRTGQVLALPEGEQRAAGGLVAFAKLDGTTRLLGGRVAAFDMRAPDRIYLRVPGIAQEDAQARAAAAKSKETP